MDNELMQQLALYKAYKEAQDDTDVFVSSVHEAIQLIQHYSSPSGARFRRNLIDFITDPDNCVFGDCDTYHNLLMALFRVGDYYLSLKVCSFALKYAPQNRDIIGDAIKACGESSRFELGEQYLETAMRIPKELWSYRLFLYSIDFLKAKLDAYPCDKELFDRARELAAEYIRCHPYDERGYNQSAELLIMMNRREDALTELRKAIKEIQPAGPKSSLVCSQCCVTLLNLLDDSSDYDEIIEISDYGLRHTTQEQPSAKIGFFMYRKALSLDAKAHAEGFRIPSTIQEALAHYQSAYDLNQDRDYARTIEQRYAVLRVHAAADFAPLVKRPLYYAEATDGE